MSARLSLHALEARENPAGPVIVDPIGVPVVSEPPPVNVSIPAAPDAGSGESGAIDKIIRNTLAALGQGW